jgi:hypothetical protein
MFLTRSEQFEPPTDNKTGSTTWPSSVKLDAAVQGAAAVRSEAEDERRSREQSLRAHQIKRLQISEARSSNQSDHSRPNVGVVSLLFYGAA